MLWLLSCAEPAPAPPPPGPAPAGVAHDLDTLSIDATPPEPPPDERSFLVTSEPTETNYDPPLAGVQRTPDGPRLLLGSWRHWWRFDVSDKQDVLFDPAETWLEDADADLAEVVGDIDGDGTDDLWVGARLRSGASPDVVLASVEGPDLQGLTVAGERVYTWDLDRVYVWEPPSSVPTATLTGTVRSVHEVGDVTGDGSVDVVAIAPRDVGRGWLLADPPAGTMPIGDAAWSTLQLDGLQVAAGADLDGDGHRELVLAGCADQIPGFVVEDQTAWVVDVQAGPIDVATAAWARGVTNEAFCHPALATGDFDGDGQDDLALGGSTFLKSVEGHDLGIVWTLSGPIARGAEVQLATEGRMHLVGPYTAFGRRLTAADLDDDGMDELLVSGALGSEWDVGSEPAVWVLQRP